MDVFKIGENSNILESDAPICGVGQYSAGKVNFAILPLVMSFVFVAYLIRFGYGVLLPRIMRILE